MSDYEMANAANTIRKLRIANKRLTQRNRVLENEIIFLKKEIEEAKIVKEENVPAESSQLALPSASLVKEIRERNPDRFDLDKPIVFDFPF